MNLFLLLCLVMTFGLRGSGYDLTIMHTNDVHARFDESDKYGGPCTDKEGKCFGGTARHKALIDKIKGENSNTLLLDAGDQFQGTMWFYFYGGELISWAMNELGYDAMAIGNHEFDRGVDGLVPFLRNVSFPALSCNIDASTEPKIQNLYKPYHIFTVGGEKIGIIGYTTTDTPMISNPDSLKFKDEVESIQRQVNMLQSQGINKIIALGHSGFEVDKHIAANVRGVDIIVGGHTNTFLYTGTPPSSDEKRVGTYPTIVTQDNGDRVLVVQDYAYGKYLGFLQVTFDNNGKVTNYSGNPILVDYKIQKDEYLENRTLEYREKLKNIATEVIGRTLVHLDGGRFVCRLGECNMGNLIADALVHQNLKHADTINDTNVFIALVNAGSIRATLERGQITGEDVMVTLPFMNSVEIVQLQGKYLQQALEHSVTEYEENNPKGRFMQVSGLRVLYDISKKEGNRVHSIHVKCSECMVPKFVPLDENKMYKIILSTFILNGGDKYTMIRDNAVKEHIIEALDTEALMEYIKKLSPITQGLEGRIRLTKDVCNVINVTNSSNILFSNMSHLFLMVLTVLCIFRR